MQALEDRFWDKVRRSRGHDSCWSWAAGCFEDGYGAFSYGKTAAGNNRVVKAHRMAFELVAGVALPSSTLLLHHCDNKRCCNPRHLYIGDYTDNAYDRRERGGNASRRKRLKPDQISELRRQRKGGARAKDLAAKYGITRQQIWSICARRAWRGIP